MENYTRALTQASPSQQMPAMVLAFGSKRIAYISVPLRSVGVRVHEVYSYGGPWRRITAAISFCKFCLRFPCGHVVIDTPQWTGLTVMLLSRLLRMKYFLVLRGDVFRECGVAATRLMNKTILRNAKGIVFLSHHLKRRISSQTKELPATAVIPCPYLQKFAPPSYKRSSTILTVTGFFFLEKVRPLLVLAPLIAELIKSRPEVVWDICGGGPYLKRMRKAIRRYYIGERIRLHGHRSDIKSFYEEASIFLYFTGLDSFGLAVVEAQLNGLPVVANMAESMPELVDDGVDGFLIDTQKKGWQNRLLDSMTLLLDDVELSRRMGISGRKKALEKYNPATIGRSLWGFINSGGGAGCHDSHDVYPPR